MPNFEKFALFSAKLFKKLVWTIKNTCISLLGREETREHPQYLTRECSCTCRTHFWQGVPTKASQNVAAVVEVYSEMDGQVSRRGLVAVVMVVAVSYIPVEPYRMVPKVSAPWSLQSARNNGKSTSAGLGNLAGISHWCCKLPCLRVSAKILYAISTNACPHQNSQSQHGFHSLIGWIHSLQCLKTFSLPGFLLPLNESNPCRLWEF